jgi:sulfatase modifying factor 1
MRAAPMSRWIHWVPILFVWMLLDTLLVDSQNILPFREVELTSALLSTVAPKLSNPSVASQLDILDELVFGKGDVLRIEGKSRKYLLLALDHNNRQFVKLFDLYSYDLNDSQLKGLIYFNGVLSKIEQMPQGIEVSISYARLSSGPGHAYSSQAETFARRRWESKRQNQEIRNQQNKPSATSELASQPPNPPSAISGKDETKTASHPPDSPPGKASSAPVGKAKDDDADDDSEEIPKNKPVLLRRGRSETQPPPPSSPTVDHKPAASSPGAIQSEQDVVIYRKNTSAGHTLAEKSQEGQQLKKEVDGMMLIPEGYVTLGSDDPLDQEKPLHRVFVQAFYIDKHEVTNREYKDFCDATGHSIPKYWQGQNLPKDLAKHPVVYVNWQDAMVYAKWAGKRLPTEAEWERAAKGPNSYRYAYGNAYDTQKANTESKTTTPAGSYPPSEFGLYDMTGNVAEWTSSLFKPYPYKRDDGREDPQAAGARVLRGAGNSSDERTARCLVRASELPDQQLSSVGFRCVRDAN